MALGQFARQKAGRLAFAAALVLPAGLVATSPALAYIGPSYLRIAGITGDARPAEFAGWVRAESNYWTRRPELQEIRGIRENKNDLLFTGPQAPAHGPEMLAVSIDKTSPALAALMALCQRGEVVSAMTFAESAELARHPQEHGPRPREVPEFYEYVLRQVRMTCPVVAGAPEQALGLQFAAIEWVNFRPQVAPVPVVVTPAREWQSLPSGSRRTFAISWFAAAVDASPGQCPRMNTKPGPADYFALLPEAEAARDRARFASAGGVGPADMPFRGPDRMHVTLMPGIVADPGHAAPVSDIAPGLDLDGDDGAGPPPPGVRAHRNLRSADGRKGIDNQLFTVEGCVEGFRRRGFLPMIFNEGRAAGRPTALIEVSGIDDPQNDDDVTVSILYSDDELRRSPAKTVLADYTFRISRNPAFTQDFARFRGRIVEGVLTTEAIDRLHMHEVTAIETTIRHPRLRLQFLADGRLKGLIGGYVDWRKRVAWQVFRASDYENTIGMQAPALYNAMKRAADGLVDPLTGEFNGISAAFDIEGVPAFTAIEEVSR